MGLYDNSYGPDNVYGHLRQLLGKVGIKRGGLHLDFGCGYGRVAEVLRDELGLIYIGFDQDAEALASLRQRGFGAVAINLGDAEAVRNAIAQASNGQTIGSLSILDALEHLVDPSLILRVLRDTAVGTQCPLIVSVPNVAHRDVGFKLAFGHWNYTLAGLLDRTHLQYFNQQGLEYLMHQQGWREIERYDVRMEKSDQHFPPQHSALSEQTALHLLLRNLRDSVDEHAITNQFVRAYLPGPVETPPDSSDPRRPFLSIITRTQGRRIDTLREVFLCLSAQTDQDFEVLVMGHRLDLKKQLAVERVIEDNNAQMRFQVRLIKIDHGNRTTPLNQGFSEARGDYIAILDDDDIVFAHWVETFRSLSKSFPGRVLRAGVVGQKVGLVRVDDGSTSVRASGGFARYPQEFDLFEHMAGNRTPNVGLAFPRHAFQVFKVQFDEDLTTTEDWDFLMRTVAFCGMANSPAVVAVYRLWENAESSITVHSREEWQQNHEHIWRKLDRTSFILPPGSASEIRKQIAKTTQPVAQILPGRPLRHRIVDKVNHAVKSNPWVHAVLKKTTLAVSRIFRK